MAFVVRCGALLMVCGLATGCLVSLDSEGVFHVTDDGNGEVITYSCGSYSSPTWDCRAVMDSLNHAPTTPDLSQVGP